MFKTYLNYACSECSPCFYCGPCSQRIDDLLWVHIEQLLAKGEISVDEIVFEVLGDRLTRTHARVAHRVEHILSRMENLGTVRCQSKPNGDFWGLLNEYFHPNFRTSRKGVLLQILPGHFGRYRVVNAEGKTRDLTINLFLQLRQNGRIVPINPSLEEAPKNHPYHEPDLSATVTLVRQGVA
ncbi:hypothetical protein SCOR_02500 [Sulfidibacter corallicola]|uniref:Uncharacterized protein n=1 Tax=Sulfidibacter corallicola TaxID=2818388 RepID=A0A8A4TG41_SULCO|nr:hypothetical protein [Sulfidibacter corallicola]QTD48603.1 hypothetical protein J3U87_23735 [Sulfidibacter corallicola]